MSSDSMPVCATGDLRYAELFCPKCGYSLKGLTSERCPECGLEIDFAELAASQIPWVHRKSQGWLRSYWRTAWFVMFHNRRFREEICHRVDYRDAQWFRWVTVLHVFVPMLLGTVVVLVSGHGREYSILESDNAVFTGASRVAGHLGMLGLLAGITGIPSYFFHGRHLPVQLQNRAVALSYYTCAPLAWTILAWVALVGAVIGREGLGSDVVGGALLVLAAVLAVAPLLAWWVYLRLGANRFVGSTKAWPVSWIVPVLWLVLAGVILPGVYLVIIFVAIVLASF